MSKFSFICNQFSDSTLKLVIIKKIGEKISKEAKIDKKFHPLKILIYHTHLLFLKMILNVI